MSEEPKPQSSKWTDWFHITLAGWVSFLVGLSLLAIGGIVGVAFHTRMERISWVEYLSWLQIGSLIFLWLSICVATYWLVRLTLSELPACEKGFADAWQAGLDSISKRGIRITEVPIFLVLGCEDYRSQQNFMQQIGFSTSIPVCPEHPDAPIRWYVSDDRIVIACQTVGEYSLAQSRLELHLKRLREEMPFNEDVANPTIVDGLHLEVAPKYELSTDPSSENHAWDSDEEIVRTQSDEPNVIPFRPSFAPGKSDSDVQRHANWPSSEDDKSKPMFSPWVDSAESSPQVFVAEKRDLDIKSIETSGIRENILFRQLEHTEELVSLVQDDAVDPSNAIAANRALESVITPRLSSNRPLLSSAESIHCQNGMRDLCSHLLSIRGDLAPINGIIIRVDAARLVRCKTLASQCGQSLRQDLDQLRLQLGIHVPTSIVLDNLHQFESFQQLIKRLGPNMAAGISLGESFGIQRMVTKSSITVACLRLMRTIHRAVYHVFKTPDGKLRPQNHKVFPLLHLCRGDLGEALREFLIQSLCASNSVEAATGQSFLQGLYAMGSGTTVTQRGFGNLVLRNQVEESDRLAWTSSRLRVENRYNTRVQFLQVICILLTCSAALLLWFCIR